MADVALTNIKHGNEDGSVIELEAGESVSKLPKDAVERLKEIGSVGPASASPEATAKENASLQEQVAELQAQLAALQNPEAAKVAEDANKAAKQTVSKPGDRPKGDGVGQPGA